MIKYRKPKILNDEWLKLDLQQEKWFAVGYGDGPIKEIVNPRDSGVNLFFLNKAFFFNFGS